jgi:hypothetical protein
MLFTALLLVSATAFQSVDFSRTFCKRRPSLLQLSSCSDDETMSRRTRVSVAGVAVSSTGFWIALKNSQFLPLRVTDDIMDQTAATSAEALTILQLLANVDMAGAILQPNLLDQIVALSCEEADASGDGIGKSIAEAAESAVKKVWDSLNNKNPESFEYSDQNPWIRSRVRLPSCSLNEVIISDDCYDLQVTVADFGCITVRLQESVLREVSYKYRPAVSAAFLAVAFALRYKAPITVLESSKHTWYDQEALRQRFPNYRDAAEVLKPADRAAVNIERGFEIHKLQSALKVARDRGDDAAAAKIRAAIDKLDAESFQDIPVQPESDTSSMQ